MPATGATSGCRCSGSPTGVWKLAREAVVGGACVGVCPVRVQPCVRVSGNEQETVSDMEKMMTEATRVVFYGCCVCNASVLRVRA